MATGTDIFAFSISIYNGCCAYQPSVPEIPGSKQLETEANPSLPKSIVHGASPPDLSSLCICSSDCAYSHNNLNLWHYRTIYDNYVHCNLSMFLKIWITLIVKVFLYCHNTDRCISV